MRLLYIGLLHLLVPAYLLWLWIQGLRDPARRGGLGERLGVVAPATAPIAVWVHAISVGETMAALPLIRALVAQHGKGRIWVTSGTATGRERVRSLLGEQVRHSYAPLDLPWAVQRFLRHVQPARAVVLETEIWPSTFRALRRNGIPLAIVNARLSERSLRRYRRLAGFTRSVLADVRLVAAQSEHDAQRFRALGASPVVCAGNIKFDSQPDAAQVESGRALRQQLGAQRPVWIAASTHAGEEAAALSAHRQILRSVPDALLILVPRHSQRFAEAASEIAGHGFRFARRSETHPDLACPVLLGDSMGEMWCYLAAADLAFVGGSLVPVGGHNVLEPAALGLPVLFGPHMNNFLEARELLLKEQAAQEVADRDRLAEAVAALLPDAAARQHMGEAGKAALARNRGALRALLNLLEGIA